ncbi:metallophosphoesterase family protein [Croceiramulus getboli]|nr:metallophosphoesterase [Flavobacteriaceae bacterium YJPT1-3]
MLKNYTLLLILSLFLFAACVTTKPQYRNDATLGQYPESKAVTTSFLLIGDSGYAQAGESTEGLLTLKNFLMSEEYTPDYTIFLGDNIYPDGMPKKGDKDRDLAEHRLNVQLDAVRENSGQVIFIPGNHDWYNEGLDGLEREEKYLKNNLDQKEVLLPENGCPLVSMDINEQVHLLIIDTQWYLADWDDHPKINDKCDEIKTREKFFIELENEVKKNQDKTILLAMHHPMITNGVHGGKFAINKHLYPSQKRVPLPVLASLVTQIRTQGG